MRLQTPREMAINQFLDQVDTICTQIATQSPEIEFNCPACGWKMQTQKFPDEKVPSYPPGYPFTQYRS